jgi:hypothetical protein
MSEIEATSATRHDRFSVVRSGGVPTWPSIWLPRIKRCVAEGNAAGALRLLASVVPDYRPSALLVPAIEAPAQSGADEDRHASSAH